jgi:hypothetical protein
MVVSDASLPNRLSLIETSAVTAKPTPKPPAPLIASGKTSYLRSIQLKNFRDFPAQRIFDFGTVNLIVGVNGSGNHRFSKQLSWFTVVATNAIRTPLTITRLPPYSQMAVLRRQPARALSLSLPHADSAQPRLPSTPFGGGTRERRSTITCGRRIEGQIACFLSRTASADSRKSDSQSRFVQGGTAPVKTDRFRDRCDDDIR